MTSPSASDWRLTRRPLTSVPFVEPRSSTVAVPPSRTTSTCLRLTPVSGSRMSASVAPPMTLRPVESSWRVPGPSTTRTWVTPGRSPARPTKEGPCFPVSVATRPRSGGSGGSLGSGGGAPGRARGGGGAGEAVQAGRVARGRAVRRSDRGEVVTGRRAGRVGDVRADLEDARREVGVLLEPDRHLVEDLVALAVDVLGDHVGELGGQLVRPLTEVLEVGAPEAHHVHVRCELPPLAHHRPLFVGLALERLRDLRRVHLALEDPGEGQPDHALEASLEALQHTHSRSFALDPTSNCANNDRSRVARPLPSRNPRRPVRAVASVGQRPHPPPGPRPPADNVVARQGKWRNGRRARFRSVCPKGRGGSTPPLPTRRASTGVSPGARSFRLLGRGGGGALVGYTPLRATASSPQ